MFNCFAIEFSSKQMQTIYLFGFFIFIELLVLLSSHWCFQWIDNIEHFIEETCWSTHKLLVELLKLYWLISQNWVNWFWRLENKCHLISIYKGWHHVCVWFCIHSKDVVSFWWYYVAYSLRLDKMRNHWRVGSKMNGSWLVTWMSWSELLTLYLCI